MMNLTNLFSTSVSDARFQLQMAKALDTPVGGPSEQRVLGAILSADTSALSRSEQRSLLAVTRQLARDGDINPRDADAITSLIEAFGGGDVDALGAFWPFADIALSRLPGNPLMNALAGYIGNELGQSLHDLAFLGAVDSLLDSANGDGTWVAALAGAFAHADLTALSGSERSELLSMLTVAAADGSINYPEAQAILARLDEFLGAGSTEPLPPPKSTGEWTVEEHGNGCATIDLGNYTLELNENGSEIWITNKETGERSRIWGDPHFDMDGDGRTDVDFWGTLTLNLEDGTKITINTTPWNGNSEMTVSSKLTITNGDQAIVVEGLDQNSIGDMTISQSSNGYLLDTFTGDGLNVYENADGAGWLVLDGLSLRPVTQDDMNRTKDMASDFSLTETLRAMTVSMASGYLIGLMTNMFFGQQDR